MWTISIHGILAFTMITVWTWSVTSDDIMIKVTDENNVPLKGAVAYIAVGTTSTAAPKHPSEIKTIQQKGEAFAPFITLLKVGDKLVFHNQDPITHHVYSFSSAKQLDLVVKPREMSKTFNLERPGPIALGSSIHDHMTAFVYATPSPLTGISNEKGELVIKGVPKGQHMLFFWHYRIPKSETRYKMIDTENDQNLSIEVATKRAVAVDKDKGE